MIQIKITAETFLYDYNYKLINYLWNGTLITDLWFPRSVSEVSAPNSDGDTAGGDADRQASRVVAAPSVGSRF